MTGILNDGDLAKIWGFGMEAARARDFSRSLIDRLTVRGRLMATTALC
jgi:hypothetical protein